MLVHAEVSHRAARAVAVGRARRRRGDEGGLVQVVLHAQVAVERGVARRDRRLVDEEVGAHRVERHRILGQQQAGSEATVEGSALPSGGFGRDRCALGRGGHEAVEHPQHRLAAEVRVRQQVDEHRIHAHDLAGHETMHAGGLGRAQTAGIDERAEVVLRAEREAVGVPLEAGEPDQVVGFRRARRHDVGVAGHVRGPPDRRVLVADDVVRAALVVVAEAHAGERALRAQRAHVLGDDAAHVVHRDVGRRRARILHEREQQRPQQHGRRIAHGAVDVRAVRARAVHVGLDGDLLTRPVAAAAPDPGVVRLEQRPPPGRRVVRARRGGDPVVHHAPHRTLVEVLALPPVARPVPGHGRRVAHPGNAPRQGAHTAPERLVRRERRIVGKLRDARRIGRGGFGRRRRLLAAACAADQRPACQRGRPERGRTHDERAPIHARCLASALHLVHRDPFRRRLPGTIAARAHFRSSGKRRFYGETASRFPVSERHGPP